MKYFTISLLNSPLNPLTYCYENELSEGVLVEVTLRNRTLMGVVLEVCDAPDFKTTSVTQTLLQQYSQKQMKAAKFISSYYFCSLGEALQLFTPYGVNRKMENGEWKMGDGEPLAQGKGEEGKECGDSALMLSSKQTEALTFLQEHPVSLLFGDTGSGKTEIYMKWFEEVLAQGKRVLFLMPEISLTPQMDIRLKEHFGEAVVMWHSKVTKPTKKKLLEKIHSGEAKIIAGARSALFLPVDDLGLIVVDEEHDDSYKASSRPRYHARDMAIYMGKLYDVPVLLGSATPSLNSYVKYPHFSERWTL